MSSGGLRFIQKELIIHLLKLGPRLFTNSSVRSTTKPWRMDADGGDKAGTTQGKKPVRSLRNDIVRALVERGAAQILLLKQGSLVEILYTLSFKALEVEVR